MEKLPLILAAIVAVAKVAKAFLDDKKNKEDWSSCRHRQKPEVSPGWAALPEQGEKVWHEFHAFREEHEKAYTAKKMLCKLLHWHKKMIKTWTRLSYISK